MLRKAFVLGGVCVLGSTCLLADFTYEQSTKITGGVALQAMKMAGVFSKQARETAREPIVDTVVVKGNRMAHINAHRGSVIDLDSETITDIDFDKKQYSVVTFAEMKQALARMQEKMAAHKTSENPDADMNFKVSVKNTGQEKVVNGFNAKEMILTMTMEGTDKKSGQTGSMDITSDMWMAPKVAGYSEVQDFHKRMAQKLAWTPGAMPMGPMTNPQMMKGMAEAAKEMSKLDGIPVMTIMKMGSAGGAGANGMPVNSEAQRQQTPPPSAGDVASESAGSAIGRKLGGGLGGLAGGGLGGFGRKKKKDDDQQQQQASSQTPPSSGDASGALMESVTEITSFSSAPVDSAKFAVPGGFKKVESPMEKMANK